MKKQTAVEWLASKLGDHIVWEEKIIDLIEQAKAMEKEQTLLFSEEYDGYVFRGGSASEEEYYDETFKSE